MFLFLGAVLVNVGSNDCGVDDITETVIGTHALFPNNCCFLGEVTATTTELFWDRDAQQACVTGLIPQIPVNLVILAEAFKVRDNFVGKEGARKVSNGFYILGHPG